MVAKILFQVFFVIFLHRSSFASDRVFTNSWAVKILGGIAVVERLARKYGFVNESQVVSDYYVFDHRMVQTRSDCPSKHIDNELLAEPEVIWAEQQVFSKYELYYFPHDGLNFNDPKWPLQWYLERNDGPSYNLLEVWKTGYTGKGVVIGVVDVGLEKDHPEIERNFDEAASFDFLEGDKDPSSSDDTVSVSHGNSCAGIIAAVANNSFCGIGMAYSARISGIRILGKNAVTDNLKARGISFKPDYVDIYSNSWGPSDSGFEIGEAGVVTEEALKQGAVKGRKGLGSIFVFAAGNGGYNKDSCAFNGLVNSIYTIAITGVKKDGSLPGYGEKCPGILAVTFSKALFSILDQAKLITADEKGKCTEHFSGSSAAAAMASGLIALAVEANKNLTWRDVQHIIIRSSKADTKFLKAKDFMRNGANLTASNSVGFGLMDAHSLVSLAVNWATVPPQLNCTVSRFSVNRLIPSKGTLKVTASLNDLSHVCRGSQINFLEHVQVRVSLNYTLRGYLEMNLTSPQGSTSLLLQSRPKDNSPSETYLTNWTILTLHHWGENPWGTWELALKNSRPDQESEGILFDWILMIYGTTTDPLDGHLHVQIPTGTVPPHKTKRSTVQPEDNRTTNFGSTFATSLPSTLAPKMGPSGLAMKAFVALSIGFVRFTFIVLATWCKNKRPTQIENAAKRG